MPLFAQCLRQGWLSTAEVCEGAANVSPASNARAALYMAALLPHAEVRPLTLKVGVGQVCIPAG